MLSKMSEEALAARREYEREWRARNRDKVKAKNRRYWEKRAQKKKEAEASEQTKAD